MSTYLLTWNPKKSLWDDYSDYRMSIELGYETIVGWSCGVRKNMPVGSRIFMMRLGYRQPIHGIFASGYTTTEPYLDTHWNDSASTADTHYVEFRLDAMLDPEIHNLLNAEIEVSKNYNWRPQSSGVEIPPRIAEILEAKWRNHLELLDMQPVLKSQPQTLLGAYTEGKLSRITVNRYERDPLARQKCIEHYGALCCVCDFSFADFYGEIGDDFIHCIT
jgi:5-methylcytosine-specific restriction enzyme A